MLVYDSELEEKVCDHAEAYTEPPCCGFGDRNESGYIDCACGGVTRLVCPAEDCTGIDAAFMEWSL